MGNKQMDAIHSRYKAHSFGGAGGSLNCGVSKCIRAIFRWDWLDPDTRSRVVWLAQRQRKLLELQNICVHNAAVEKTPSANERTLSPWDLAERKTGWVLGRAAKLDWNSCWLWMFSTSAFLDGGKDFFHLMAIIGVWLLLIFPVPSPSVSFLVNLSSQDGTLEHTGAALKRSIYSTSSSRCSRVSAIRHFKKQ